MCRPGWLRSSLAARRSTRRRAPPGGRYYFDWARREGPAQGPRPSRPAVPLVLALDVALDMIEEEGLEDVFARHAPARPRHPRRRRRARPRALRDRRRAPTVVTALELPDDVDGGKVPGALRKLGITANGGQDQLKGKIIRLAHCGYFGAFDILTSLAASRWRCPARPRGRARSRRRRGPARLRRSRTPGGRHERRPSRTASSSTRRSPTPASTLLREHFDVDLGIDWADGELAEQHRRLRRAS